MFKIQLHSQMGNQMFQYVFALYVSKKLGVPFCLEYKKSDGGLQLLSFALPMPHRLLVMNRLTRFIYRKIYGKKQFLSTCIESIEDLRISSAEIVLQDGIVYKGYFQKSFFAETIIDDLRSVFNIRWNIRNKFKTKYFEVLKEPYAVVHLRFKDYDSQYFKNGNDKIPWSLPTDWYTKQVSKFVPEEMTLVIISDDIIKAKSIDFSRKRLLYPEGNAIEHFQLLLSARTIIISNSTYAWWGAFLNQVPDRKVYAPINWVGYNAGFEYPAGIMTKEFIWV